MNVLDLGPTDFDDFNVYYLISISAFVLLGLIEVFIRAFLFGFHLFGIITSKIHDIAATTNNIISDNGSFDKKQKKKREKRNSLFLAFVILISSLFIRITSLASCLFLLFPSLLRDFLLKGQDILIYYQISFFLLLINIILTVIPFVFGAYMIARKVCHKKVDLREYPMVYIIVPIYNEIPQILEKNIDAILASKYPKDRVHLILAFDDEYVNKSYVSAIKKFRIYASPANLLYPAIIQTNCLKAKISICRFPHEGKRITQMNAFRHIQHEANQFGVEIEPSSMIFLIDSDIILDPNAISNMVFTMRKGNYEALTGFILINEASSLIERLQDMEYFQGQIIYRYFENTIGGVTCLPGALTVITLQAFKKIAGDYFKKGGKSIKEYHQSHLGEDRFLTYLLLDKCKPYSLGFCYLSNGETDAPKSVKSLIIQRRRWLLGTVSNDAHMLTNTKLWRKAPILMTFTLLNGSRDLGWMLLAMYIAIPFLTKPLYIVLIVLFLPIGLVWLLCIIGGFQLKRHSFSIFFPLTQLFNQFLSLMIAVYSLFTLHKMTWGGPRTNENITLNIIEGTRQRRDTRANTCFNIQEPVVVVAKDNNNNNNNNNVEAVENILLSVYQSYS